MKNVTPEPTATESTALLILPGLDAAVPTATEAARKMRDDLLAVSRRGTLVASADSAQRAGMILKDITAFIRLIEATRAAVKAPVIQLGKDVDAAAGELVRELEAEKVRIGNLIAQFQAAERAREEEARRRAAEEQARIIREQQERERKAREEAEAAERARRMAEERAKAEAAELEAKASRARSAERQAELQAQAEAKRKADAEAAAKAEADRQAALAKEEAARVDAQKALAATNTAVSMAASTKIAGISLRKDVEFEVTDIVALYDALPGMVLLTPNKAAIKAHLKTLPEGQSLPGVSHRWIHGTSVR